MISIHTPHAGSDGGMLLILPVERLFQSTLPMRGVTKSKVCNPKGECISIHTPHAGSDNIVISEVTNGSSISIHTPHAGSDLKNV